MDKIRTKIAKTLIPCGVSGDAIDVISECVERDVNCPVFKITQTDVAKMQVRYRPERDDVVVFAGRRDWQFRKDGSMVGAGYGLCF
jgi:hypothetical protein